MGTLYLVATPIGNLDDISARSLTILRQVRLIAAEDTRKTKQLLAHYQIQTQLTSYYEYNKLSKLEKILATLSEGDVALVSDAGTPALNDPGYELVRAVLKEGYPVSPIPGACAPIAALVASGLPTDAFVYLGYLPRRGGERRRFLEGITALRFTLIFLEAPHRLCDSLKDLLDVLGDRPIAVARELTKLYEEIYRGNLSQALEHFTQQSPRGEFTLVVGGNPGDLESWTENQLRSVIYESLAQGDKPAVIASRLAMQSGWPRRSVYQLVMRVRQYPSKGEEP